MKGKNAAVLMAGLAVVFVFRVAFGRKSGRDLANGFPIDAKSFQPQDEYIDWAGVGA